MPRKLPAGQVVAAVELGGQKPPGGHSVVLVRPLVGQARPASQARHAAWPALGWYLPGAQGVTAVAPGPEALPAGVGVSTPVALPPMQT